VRRGTSWTWFWLARRKGGSGWSDASTSLEAIGRVMLVPPRKLPGWPNEAAADGRARVDGCRNRGRQGVEPGGLSRRHPERYQAVSA